MKILLCGLLCGVLVLVCCPAYADTTADLTEDNVAAGVPSPEQAALSNFHGILGLGVFNFKKMVGDSDRITFPLPIIIITYKDLAYWTLGGGGVWLLQSDYYAAKLGLGIKAHPGWKSGDDPLLTDMTERKNSVDGYINALAKSPIVNISAAFYHDIGNVSKGSSASARVSHNFWFDRKFRLTPSIGAEWQNAKLVDYYYGVRLSEVIPNRPSYSGRDTMNISAGLGGLYLINRNWSLLGGLYAVHFGNGITDSPIVKQSNTALVYFGGGWLF
ncbi:MAG: MipA/OmpV family protein [Nitrospirae bacterium]|nr:MipA/OmpV family protein [Nitrospirota bacterium]